MYSLADAGQPVRSPARGTSWVSFRRLSGAVGGTLADQWKDFYTVPDGLPPTAALFAAVPQGTNAGRGSNTKGSSNIITNGSKIVVPEGYGLLLFQDGAITGFAAEAGGYEWRSDDLNSKSIFAGDGIVSPLDQAELGALQVRRPAGLAAGRVLRLAEGTAGQPLRHPVGDLLGRRLPQHPGRRGHARLLHAEDRRPDPVREELRAGHATCSPARSSTSPTSTTPPPASCSTRSSARWRRPSACTRTTRPRATASPSSSRTRSASRRACPHAVEKTTSGGPSAAWRSSRPRSSRSSTTRTPANCSRPCSAPMRCRARAATPTCRPASPQGIQSAGENGGAAGLMGMGMASAA